MIHGRQDGVVDRQDPRARRRAHRVLVVAAWLSPALAVPGIAWLAGSPAVQAAQRPTVIAAPLVSPLTNAPAPEKTTAIARSSVRATLRPAAASPKPQVASPTKVVVTPPPIALPVAAPTQAPMARMTRSVQATGPTGWAALDNVIAQFPAAFPPITWRIKDLGGHWGTTQFEAREIDIAPTVPADKIFDVVVHEWSHIRSTDTYGGNIDTAFAAMRATFTGLSIDGIELAADCMAVLQGAKWTFYTPCTNPSWRAAAEKLLGGQRL